MNAPLSSYVIQNPRLGVYWIIQTSTGYIRFQRPSQETAEAKVAEMLVEDAASSKAKAELEARRRKSPPDYRRDGTEYSDGAQEGNGGLGTARVPRERFE